MNLKNFGKLLVVGVFAHSVVFTGDKIEKRPVAHYPTPKRVAVMLGMTFALNYGGAFLEQKLGLTEKNVKFPFND